jgi:hypothetical protein
MDGIFIPKEILKIQELNVMEKLALSLYKYYTEKGKNKCCSLTKPQTADELNISMVYLKKIRKRLKELGYIRTSGNKVFYLGIPTQGDTIVTPKGIQEYPQGDTIVTPKGIQEYPQGDTIVTPKGIQEYPHKEEKEELKKEIKEELSKEEKIARANFKLLVDEFYPTYKTPKQIKFVWEEYKERLSSVDFTEGGIIDSWVQGIQNILLKKFPEEHMTQVTPTPKTKSNTIDVL